MLPSSFIVSGICPALGLRVAHRLEERQHMVDGAKYRITLFVLCEQRSCSHSLTTTFRRSLAAKSLARLSKLGVNYVHGGTSTRETPILQSGGVGFGFSKVSNHAATWQCQWFYLGWVWVVGAGGVGWGCSNTVSNHLPNYLWRFWGGWGGWKRVLAW